MRFSSSEVNDASLSLFLSQVNTTETVGPTVCGYLIIMSIKFTKTLTKHSQIHKTCVATIPSFINYQQCFTFLHSILIFLFFSFWFFLNSKVVLLLLYHS